MHGTEVLAALMLALATTAATAEVYKWVDQDGRVHYGDRKPAGSGAARPVELPPAPSPDAEQVERSRQRRRLLEAFETERAERQQAEAQASAARQERDAKCAKFERELARVERANVVYTQDESGARVYMSDEERDRMAADARAWIEKHCD